MSKLPRAARLYVLSVIIAGAAALVWTVPHLSPTIEILAGILLFTLLATAADLKQLRINSATYSVATATNFACAIILGPAAATLVSAVGAATGDAVARKPLHKALFNTAAVSISTAIASAALAALRVVHDTPTLVDLPAFLGYTVIHVTVNFLLVCTVIALSTRRPLWEVVVANHRGVFAPLFAMYPLGLLMAVVYLHFGTWVGLSLLVVPVIAAYSALERTQQLGERNRTLGDALERNRELYQQLSAAHEQLKSAQEQMLQQERLRALGQMASGIAHDFNNALTPIVGFSELLLMPSADLRDVEWVRENAGYINLAARDAAAVVERLRAFYRQRDDGDELAPVDLNVIVGQAIEITRTRWRTEALAAGRTIDVRAQLGDVPPALGDESALRELLTNLIFNAVDAMPSGGVITIATRPEQDRALLEVRDTGTGMTEDVRRRCLDPFFTTKGEHGTGLGLSMVHGIVQRHDGTLEIASAPGEGTAVRVTLSLYTADEDDGEAPAEEDTNHTLCSRTIQALVVDDEPGVRAVLSAYLTRLGASTQTASDGEEGLRRFLEGRFDVVVTDRSMPGLNGDQLAQAVKAADASVPVIMVSGYAEQMALRGEQPEGVDVLLPKPVMYSALQQALLSVLPTQAPALAFSEEIHHRSEA